jgi:hypothetical protein
VELAGNGQLRRELDLKPARPILAGRARKTNRIDRLII